MIIILKLPIWICKKVDKDMLLNTLCGSPMYMAPEIINKQDYSIKSDLWSIGIIIYQMIYGRVPLKLIILSAY